MGEKKKKLRELELLSGLLEDSKTYASEKIKAENLLTPEQELKLLKSSVKKTTSYVSERIDDILKIF